MKNLILIDMDEVLVNFVGPWLARMCPHMDYDDLMAMDWKSAGDLQTLLDIDRDHFMEELYEFPAQWWRDLPWMPGGKDLLKLVQDSGIPWAICSAPSACPNAAAGKIQWMKDVLGPVGKKKLILCDNKTFLAREGVLLIDDMMHNTKAFHEAGGAAVLVPRPWNDGTEADYEYLKEGLRFAAQNL